MKQTMLLAGLAAAAVTAYFMNRKNNFKKTKGPEMAPARKIENHITDVFSRAKSFAGN